MEQAGQTDSLYGMFILFHLSRNICRNGGNPVGMASGVNISFIHDGSHGIDDFHIAFVQLLVSLGQFFILGADQPVELAVMQR